LKKYRAYLYDINGGKLYLFDNAYYQSVEQTNKNVDPKDIGIQTSPVVQI